MQIDTRTFNRQIYKDHRKKLRAEATYAEKDLWLFLKGAKMDGFKFRRQHGIGRYIVDFYCPEARLVIEIDGEVHDQVDQRGYDELRQAEIESQGIQVLRFTNAAVQQDRQNVLNRIHQALSKTKHP